VELPGGCAAVQSFSVSPRFGRPPDVALLRQDLARALDGSLQLADALAAKERDYGETSAAGLSDIETKVLWFDDEATGAVVLELRTTDRIGLLHRVAAAVESNSVTIRWARVVTMGGTAVDSFCLTVPGGHSAPDGHFALRPQARERIEHAVLSAAR
jgi:[protein-PII] uridylyltransferase